MEICHCGRPLHYANNAVRALIEEMIRDLGPTLIVEVSGRRWKVPRHYIALHGIKGDEVAALGFEEVKES